MSEDLGGREIVSTYFANSAATVTDGSPLIYTDKIVDTVGAYNSTTGVYTVPEAGTYLITASARFSSSTVNIGIEVNGTEVYLSGSAPAAGDALPNISHQIKLAKGDTLEIVNTTGSSRTLSSSGSGIYNNLSITKLASPQTILETETVAARYTSNNGQSIGTASAQTVIYEDLIEDTHGSYNTSTGIYTAPLSGWYAVNATTTFAALATAPSNITFITVEKNGATVSRVNIEFDGTITADNTTSNVTTLINLAKGDTINIDLFQNSGGSEALVGAGDRNTFSIARIK